MGLSHPNALQQPEVAARLDREFAEDVRQLEVGRGNDLPDDVQLRHGVARKGASAAAAAKGEPTVPPHPASPRHRWAAAVLPPSPTPRGGTLRFPLNCVSYRASQASRWNGE